MTITCSAVASCQTLRHLTFKRKLLPCQVSTLVSQQGVPHSQSLHTLQFAPTAENMFHRLIDDFKLSLGAIVRLCGPATDW